MRQKIEKFRSRIDRYRETIRESYEAEQEEAAEKIFQNEGVRKLLLKAFLRHIEVKLINTKAESTATLFHTFITSHENQILRLLNEKIQSNPKSATGLISTNYESPIIDEAAISNHTELFIEVMEELTVKASGFLQKIKSILRGKLGIKPKDKDIKKSLIEFLRSDTGEDRYLENNPQTDEKRFKTRKDHQKLIDIREKIHGKEDLNNLLSDADVTHEFVRAEKFRRKLLAIDSIDETVEQAFASENLEIEAIFYEYIFRQPEVQAVLDTNNAIIQEFLDTLFRKFAAGSLNSALLTMKTEEEDNNSVLLTAFSEAESEDMKEKIRLLRKNIIHIYNLFLSFYIAEENSKSTQRVLLKS